MLPKGLNEVFIQQLMSTHAKSGKMGNWLPIFFSGEAWRYKSMQQTLKTITDPVQYQNLQHHAFMNLTRWRKNDHTPPAKVEVITQDWGTTCLEMTQQYGAQYTVLNHANAHFPGGGFLRFGNAQEENMWHRTTCALSLSENGIYFDHQNSSFRYTPSSTQLLSANVIMNASEQAILKQKTGIQYPNAYRVYSSDVSRVCFRGPEFLINHDQLQERGGKNTILADPSLSFEFLPSDLIFPFYELRSAAPNLALEGDNSATLRTQIYQQSIRRCIAAQLDTLIVQGRKHVILGAWGCGEFHNDPHIVARIYQEEISKRAEHFLHIAFAILRTASHHHINHTAFEEHLAELKLGASAQNTKSSWSPGA
ncbi:MAG: poly(ADP-ribose) glycohydrolase domain-containing protein [Gammaproteobacteria bacterium]